MVECDTDNSGTIDFSEFLLMLSRFMNYNQMNLNSNEIEEPMIVQVVEKMNWSAEQLVTFQRVFQKFTPDGDAVPN